VILINGEIGWDITFAEFQNELNKETGDFEIQIASGGGSVFQGIQIYNAIKAYNKGKVTTVITSLAASMASYIALAGDTVKAYDNAVYMIHNASVYVSGDHYELRKKANIVEGLSAVLAKRYVSKTAKTDKEIKKMMDVETYLYGDEILANGFVDEIIKADESGDKSQALALANETFKSCLSSTHTRVTEQDFEGVKAYLKSQEPEKTKEDIAKEESAKNALKVNAMKARLSHKEKENNEK